MKGFNQRNRLRRKYNLSGRAVLAIAALCLVITVGGGSRALAASCCGGGSASSLVLPKLARAEVNVSWEAERYDGFWDIDENWVPDPPGSDLAQYRVNLGVAYRLGARWQIGLNLPYVWNRTDYAGLHSSSDGYGDATFSIRYETFEYVMCLTDIEAWQDLLPAVYLGATLTIPTGVSPYDDVGDNFDITGRGFYRLEGTVLIEKTVFPWNLSLDFSYGFHFARDVNQEWGVFVEPYEKKLGERFSASAKLGYGWDLPGEGALSMFTLTPSIAYGYLWEGRTRYDGVSNPDSGMKKESITLSLALGNHTNEWIGTASWNHGIQDDGWGRNFPTSDTITLGVTHVFYD